MSAIPLSKSENNQQAFVHWARSFAVRKSFPKSYSNSGKVSNELWDKIQKDKIRTITSAPDNVRLERELSDIQQECSEPDWNGYGAKPLDRDSVQHVCKFLEILPECVSYPELCAEPNGDLAMIWQKQGYHVVVGIDGDGKVTWGGTGPDPDQERMFGDAKFFTEIPKVVLDMLYSIEGNR